MAELALQDLLNRHVAWLRWFTAQAKRGGTAAELREFCALDGAAATRPIFTHYDFYGCALRDADLRYLVADRTRFCDMDLRGIDLRGASLRDSNFTRADLRGANLAGAVLYGVTLRGAQLCGARLAGVNFLDADLKDADFTGADLRSTSFHDADLRGATLTGARELHISQLLRLPRPRQHSRGQDALINDYTLASMDPPLQLEYAFALQERTCG